MALTGTELFRSRQQVFATLVSSMQAIISDIWTGEDGNLMILFEVEAAQIEGLYLANQLVLQDMFVPSASPSALDRFGDMYGYPRKTGNNAVGNLSFTGTGGTFVPIGTEVAYVPGGGLEVLYYKTTQSGTLSNPGTPAAPVAIVGAAGNLTGTYEYTITFVTTLGETVPSVESNAVAVTASQINLSNISLGGTGTIGRKIYRSLNGAAYKFVAQLGNNTSTTYTDNILESSLAGAPPLKGTASAISLPATSEAPGTAFNALPRTITVLTNAPDGLDTVTNPLPFTAGTDAENSEDFRARLLDVLRNPQDGSPSDIESWSLAVEGVASATVFANDNLGVAQNGHVTVRIAGSGGSQPTPQMIADVQTTLNDKDIVNITIHVTNFIPLTTDIAVTVAPSGTYTLPDITASVQTAIIEYITSLGVGRPLYVAGIYDAVFGLPGVATLVVNTPTSDQTTSAIQKRVPGSITVN